MTQGRPTAAPAIWPYENTPLSETTEWLLPPRPQRVLKHWAPKVEVPEWYRAVLAKRAAERIDYDRNRYERERRSARR